MFSLLAARRGCFRRRGRPFPATAPAAFARHRLAGGGGFNSPARSGDGGSSACPQTRGSACAGATASRGSAHSDAPRDRTRPRSGDTTPGPSAPSVRRRGKRWAGSCRPSRCLPFRTGGPGRSRKRTTQSCPRGRLSRPCWTSRGRGASPRRKESGRVCDTACRRGPAGSARWGRSGRRGPARTMPRASRDQAAWLQKRWKRHPCPGPTRPAEKRRSGMKRRRPDTTQPATSSTKVRKGGGVKTAWKSCSRRRKGG